MKAVIENLLKVVEALDELEEGKADYYQDLLERSIDSIRQLPKLVPFDQEEHLKRKVERLSKRVSVLIVDNEAVYEANQELQAKLDTKLAMGMTEKTSEYVLELEKRVAELHAAIGDWESKFSCMEMMRNKLTHVVNELENKVERQQKDIADQLCRAEKSTMVIDKLKLKNNIVCRKYNAQTQELITAKCNVRRMETELNAKEGFIAQLMHEANEAQCTIMNMQQEILDNASPDDLLERLVIACNKRDGE